jgi:hypothetical protein
VDDPHFWAGIAKPAFWLLLLPFLVALRWVLNRYLRPHIKPAAWSHSQAPVNDVGAAVAIIAAIVIAGLLVACGSP